MKQNHEQRAGVFAPLTLVLGILLLASCPARAAKTLYAEDFQTYTTANPAPNPLISGIPANGQWYFVDPTPPTLAAGEDFTPTSSNIEGSRGWASSAANGLITNAISLAALRPGASHTFRLTFVAACARPVGEVCVFNYGISSSAGHLTFISGRNLDDSQTLTSLSGTANANGGTVKSADRTFEFIFQGDGLTTADTINFSITRVTGNPTANANFLMDDVRLESEDEDVFSVDSVKGMLTLQNVRVFFTDDVAPQEAINAADYSITGASVLGVTLLNSNSVELTTTALTPGAQYSLQVSGVLDLNGNVVSGGPFSFTVPTTPVAKTLYLEDWESYPTQNPAPSPILGGPAGGLWYFVDPAPPLAAGDSITTASGSITNSRGWASTVNNAGITNAISLAALRSGPSHTFRLTFVAACVSTPLVNAVVFNYNISSSAGPLTLISGRNLDDSQTFTSLSGTGRAVGGTTKSLNRNFEFIFQGNGLTTADTINFSMTRVIGAPVVATTFLLDDVRLQVQDNVPLGVEFAKAQLTLQHVRVSFTEDDIGPEAATNAANYSLTGGASVLGATLLNYGVVELSTTPLTPGAQYSLQVSGVTNLSGNAVSGGPVSFTVPTAAPVIRYDAGNTVTFPDGPLSPPTNFVCDGFWTFTGNTNVGMSVAAVANDNGTGLNAWQVTDQNIGAGTGFENYNLTPSPGSVQFAAKNAWHLTARVRYVDNFFNAQASQYVLFGDASVRRATLGLGINGDGFLFVNTSRAFPLPSLDPFAYHTYDVVFDPARGSSYYVDGQLVAPDQNAQAAAGLGLTFGAFNTAGAGQANYNLVQLDVLGASSPVVSQQPPPHVIGVVGQTATITAGFTGWVNRFQWLSNGIVVADGVGPSYTTPPLTSDYDGVEYSCKALSLNGCVDTSAAVLKVYAQPASVSISPNGANVDVSYFGILESTTVISPATWTPVATNLVSGSIYSVSASGAPQQFFRARLPQ